MGVSADTCYLQGPFQARLGYPCRPTARLGLAWYMQCPKLLCCCCRGARVLAEVAAGLLYLHDRNIVHADFKSR